MEAIVLVRAGQRSTEGESTIRILDLDRTLSTIAGSEWLIEPRVGGLKSIAAVESEETQCFPV